MVGLEQRALDVGCLAARDVLALLGAGLLEVAGGRFLAARGELELRQRDQVLRTSRATAEHGLEAIDRRALLSPGRLHGGQAGVRRLVPGDAGEGRLVLSGGGAESSALELQVAEQALDV